MKKTLKEKNMRLDESKFESLCFSLIRRLHKDEKKRRYAKTKEILSMIGKGVIFTTVLFAPKLSRMKEVKEILNSNEEEYYKYVKYYNMGHLKRSLKKLREQKMIEVVEKGGKQTVELTKNGKRKVLKFAIDEIVVNKSKKWDGKWRVVIYDISRNRNVARDVLRSTLKRLGFLKLQGSVYIIPYPCEDEIEFVKAYYNLQDAIQILVISNLENDSVYRKYFGLGIV